jgi:TRAP-type C4-dicarboxylate transport system permease large subunit
LDASLSMAELERQIIRIGMGNPAVSGRAGRFDIMNTIAQSVDNIDELDSLRNSIANGNAITIIQDAIKNNRMLTEEDVDAIITNARSKIKQMSLHLLIILNLQPLLISLVLHQTSLRMSLK